MTYKEFKDSVVNAIVDAERTLGEGNIFDLRVFRAPYKTNIDNAIFMVCEIQDAWDFVKDSEEWFIDIYENVFDEDGFGHAEYTDFTIWSK